ncbi:hypothetical protein Tco_0903441 [Tanacetum coccineum]
MPYDFEMKCKTTPIYKKPNLEIGTNICHPSCTDVGSCGSALPFDMYSMHESSSSKHMDVMVNQSPFAYKQTQITGNVTSYVACATGCSTDIGKDIGISSFDDCMTNVGQTEATQLASGSYGQVQLNKRKRQVTFGGKQTPFAEGKNLINTHNLYEGGIQIRMDLYANASCKMQQDDSMTHLMVSWAGDSDGTGGPNRVGGSNGKGGSTLIGTDVIEPYGLTRDHMNILLEFGNPEWTSVEVLQKSVEPLKQAKACDQDLFEKAKESTKCNMKKNSSLMG